MQIDKAFRRVWRIRILDQIFFIPVCGLCMFVIIAFGGYRIRRLKELRRYYRELSDSSQPPLMICSNHLTYIDSILLIYAFGNHFWYAFNFRRLSWNLPAANYAKNPLFFIVGLFSKCIFINRQGSKDHKNEVLNVARKLLERGETLTVFPEGRRSKTGLFDDSKLAFGIGKILSPLPRCRVLCVYLRGEKQKSASRFPEWGSRFDVLTELVEYSPPETSGALITQDIAARIKNLESRYLQGRDSDN